MEDIGRYYETLGLGPGASPDEVKQAYRDLVQVWHPDRFAHDPRLQQKAQAKVKEINEAYARLQSAWGDLLRDQPAPSESPSSSAEPAERPSGERVRNLLTWAPSSERFTQALADARIPDLTRVLESLKEQRTEGERRGRIEAELRRRPGTPPRPASQEDTSQPQRGEATNELEPIHEAARISQVSPDIRYAAFIAAAIVGIEAARWVLNVRRWSLETLDWPLYILTSICGIYFWVWVYRLHRTLKHATRGEYPIGPVNALWPYLLAPLFNVFLLLIMARVREAIVLWVSLLTISSLFVIYWTIRWMREVVKFSEAFGERPGFSALLPGICFIAGFPLMRLSIGLGAFLIVLTAWFLQDIADRKLAAMASEAQGSKHLE